VRHFGAVHAEAVGVGRLHAWSLPDGAVHVDHGAAGSAHEVMVVVADPALVASRTAGDVDTTGERGAMQRLADVVRRLHRDAHAGRPNPVDDLVHARVVVRLREDAKDGQARCGDP
jgi:hypothetical protein